MNENRRRAPLLYALATCVLTTATAHAQPWYDRHVIFANSLTPDAYYRSKGSAVSPSELDLVNGKFPVEGERCVSPPNCLRLTWLSAQGGDWSMTLDLTTHWGRLNRHGDALSFWAFSDLEVPSIRLLGADKVFPAGKWVRVRLPFASFTSIAQSTSDARFDPSRLVRITIVQGLDEGTRRTLYLDDVRISDEDATSDTVAPAAPAGLSARGFDRHVDLAWARSAEPDLLHYKIYRSVAGGPYTPIAIQKGHLTRYPDFLGESGKTASYRISAVDTRDNESPQSAAVTASTREMSDDELLTMVQEASFR